MENIVILINLFQQVCSNNTKRLHYKGFLVNEKDFFYCIIFKVRILILDGVDAFMNIISFGCIKNKFFAENTRDTERFFFMFEN